LYINAGEIANLRLLGIRQNDGVLFNIQSALCELLFLHEQSFFGRGDGLGRFRGHIVEKH